MTMGNIKKNISSHELICNCGCCDVNIQEHEPIIDVIQKLCDAMAESADVEKVVLKITSSARCHEYNRVPTYEGGPGSNDQSQHPRCNAMDVQIFADGKQISPRLIHEYMCQIYPKKFGLGLYVNFNHIDTREKIARWVAV